MPPSHHIRSRSALALLIAAGVVIAGCSTAVTGSPQTSTVGSTTASTTSTTSSSDTSPTDQPDPGTTAITSTTASTDTSTTETSSTTTTTTEPTEYEPPEMAFGATYTWSTGVTMSVAAPKTFTPSDPEDRKRGKLFLSFQVTMTNGSTSTFIPTRGSAIARDGEETGKAIIEKDTVLGPQLALAPGQKVTWTKLYGLPGRDNLKVSVQPYDGADDVDFTEGGEQQAAKAPAGQDDFESTVDAQRFGGSYTFATGIKITTRTFSAFTPGDYSYGEKSPRYIQTSITVLNGTRETLTPTDLSYGLSENGVERSNIRDSQQKIDAFPDGRIPPGKSYTVKVAFGVTGTKNLVLDVRMDESGSVAFTDIAGVAFVARQKGAPTTTPSTSGGSGTVDAKVAVRGSIESRIGSTISWTNGVTATVGAPQRFSPSSLTRQPQGTVPVKYSVTITNGSKEPLTSVVILGAASGGLPCTTIIDTRAAVGIGRLALEPGKTGTFSGGCFAKDPDDLVISVRPDSPYDLGFFTSAGPQKPRAAAASPEAEKDSATRKFGQTFTYVTGLSLKVELREATPVSQAAGDDTTYLAVVGTFTNTSTTPFRIVSWNPRVTSGNDPVDEFTNPREFITIPDLVWVLPGRSLTFIDGVVVKNPDDVVAAVRDPSYDGPTVTWTR